MKTILFLLLLAWASAFMPAEFNLEHKTYLSMAPRFDKKLQRWSPTTPEEGPEAGYDIWGSLLRQGPNPFFSRLINPDGYEQGVLKFMAVDKVDRKTAQADMDAYIGNPSDWAYNRAKGYNPDYLTLNKKQIVLTVIWSVGILSLLGRGAYCVGTGDSFWAILGQ